MDKKAIFFDIDGTLYDNDAHGVLDETKKVLKQLSKREDVDCYLATGRSYPAVLFLKDILPYFKGFNLANGSYVEYKGKLLFEKPLDPLFLKKIRSFLEKEKISYGLITKENTWIRFFDPIAQKNFEEYLTLPWINLKESSFDEKTPIDEMWIFAERKKIEEIKILFPEGKILSWGSYGADCIDPSTSKAKGIEEIQKIKGYKKENMYAFGDGENDLEMFDVVGMSFAMEKGVIQAKEKATKVISSIQEGINIINERDK